MATTLAKCIDSTDSAQRFQQIIFGCKMLSEFDWQCKNKKMDMQKQSQPTERCYVEAGELCRQKHTGFTDKLTMYIKQKKFHTR